MGDRAVITASKVKDSGLGIYLHWNGSIESVVAFCDVARQLNYRDPTIDEDYGMARLCSLICLVSPFADAIGGAGSGIRGSAGVGINDLSKLDCDNCDNGVYVIGPKWEIEDRWGLGSKPFKREDIEAARESQSYTQVVDYLIKELGRLEPAMCPLPIKWQEGCGSLQTRYRV